MIVIKSSSIQFKNPQIGQPTRATEEHYNGRSIRADVDGKNMMFRFEKEEMPFMCDEDEMVKLIEQRIAEENESK